MSSDGTNPFSDAANATGNTNTVTDQNTGTNTTTGTNTNSGTNTGTGTGTTVVNPDDYTNSNVDDSGTIDTNGASPPAQTFTNANNSAIYTIQGDADGYRYDAENDYIYINNLPFDGLNDDPYVRYALAPNTNEQFGVYRSINSVVVSDTLGMSLTQQAFRAIYGSSPSGGSQVSIVKTGDYINEGFGGFTYQRLATDLEGNDMGLILPANGQAYLSGGYQGLIVFKSNLIGINHVIGTAQMTIDFEDFDVSPALYMTIEKRQIFDDTGADITASYTHYEVENPDGTNETYHRNVSTVLESGILSLNGEFEATAEIPSIDADGTVTGILSGDGATEAVGVVEVEWAHPSESGATAVETGGFIVTRQ